MARATAGLRRRFLSLRRPLAVLNRTWVPSKSPHTGVTCGVPSVFTVARLAKAFFCRMSLNPSGMPAIVLSFRRLWSRPLARGWPRGRPLGEEPRPGLGQPAHREQQPYQTLLHQLTVLGGRIRHPLPRPLALLGLEPER